MKAEIEVLNVTVPEWLCHRCAVGQSVSGPCAVINITLRIDQG